MREARCETQGMRIPLLGGYRSNKKNSKSLAGILAFFSCLRKYNRFATFFLISATEQFHRRSDDVFRPNNLTVDTTSIAFPLMTMGAKSTADLANEIRSSFTSTRLAGTCFG